MSSWSRPTAGVDDGSSSGGARRAGGHGHTLETLSRITRACSFSAGPPAGPCSARVPAGSGAPLPHRPCTPARRPHSVAPRAREAAPLLTQHARAPSARPLSAPVARPAAPRRRLAFGLQPHLAVVPAASHRISLTWRLSARLQYLPCCPASQPRARRAFSPAGRALRHAAPSWHPDRTPSQSSALDQGHRIPVPAVARLRCARSSAPYSGRRPAGAVSGHGVPKEELVSPAR
jgi:hypothetical protein